MRLRNDNEEIQLGVLIKQTWTKIRRRLQERRLFDKLIARLPATAVVLVLASLILFLAVDEPYQIRSSDTKDRQNQSVSADRRAELGLDVLEQQGWLDMAFHRGYYETNNTAAQDDEASSVSLAVENSEVPDESQTEVSQKQDELIGGLLSDDTMDQEDVSELDHRPLSEDELIPEPEEEPTPSPYPELTDAQGNPIEGMPADHFHSDDSQFYISVERANVRQEPNAESDSIAMLTIGMTVQRKGYGLSWSKVETDNGVTGFILTSLLSDQYVAAPTPYPEMTDAQGNPIEGMPVDHFHSDDSQFYISVERANVRQEPNAESDSIAMLSMGMTVQRKGYGLSWSKVETDYGTTGFVLTSLLSGDYVATPTPAPTPTPVPTPTPAPAPTPTPAPENTSSSTSSNHQKIIDLTRSFIGTPYVFGGATPAGFDCSGMVYYTYRHLFNITLPRIASDQARAGQSVSASNVQPGDILCFDWSRNGRVDHVGIYIGNGKYIHASASRGRVAEGTARFGSDPIVTIRRILN